MKYQFRNGFTPICLEHKDREGSLYIAPGKVLELSEADAAALAKQYPKIWAQTFALPVPKSFERKAPEPEPEVTFEEEFSDELAEFEDEDEDEDED